MRTTWPVLLATAIVCLFSTAVVNAECPNGCSGNGDCMAKDMCECYKSFQGNDCADRTCLFGPAHVDTPKGDINMDGKRDTSGWILANSQQHPAQTYEFFSPDASDDEAHFYMECSNKGICDRSTGLCQCFDGYEGNGCQRTTCPGKCNGHGTCESIRELGLKAGGTLFGSEGPAGVVTYDLWDSNSTYGCRCDPWYFGPDCNRRNCKVGVDPLFLSAGTPTYETFVIHAYVASGGSLTGAWIRLRLFDYYGESYITQKITVTNDVSSTATDVENAIKNVPNQTFRTVKCIKRLEGTSNLSKFQSARPSGTLGSSIVCQFNDNPGKIRIPEIASSSVVASAFVVTTGVQGADDELFTSKTTAIADVVGTTGTTVTTTAAYTNGDFPAVPFLFKIGAHILMVTAKATGTTFTIAYGFPHTLGTGSAIFLPQSGAVTVSVPKDTAGTPADLTVTAATVGSDLLKLSAAPDLTTIAVGDTIFFHNSFFSVQRIYQDTDWYIKVDKPFGGKSADGSDVAAAVAVYKVVVTTDKTKVYNYVSECSGRGLCGYDTGICTCFKGYTNDNCNRQNILAV